MLLLLYEMDMLYKLYKKSSKYMNQKDHWESPTISNQYSTQEEFTMNFPTSGIP